MRAGVFLSVFWVTAIGPFVQAQSIQWASRVVNVSSEKSGGTSGEQYKASQALGSPSKVPALGESPCAWSPQQADGTADEWIHVGFARPIRPRQIIVAENVNPGAVIRIIAFDEKGTEHLVYQAPGIQERTDPLLRIFPKDAEFLCAQLKVIINGFALKGINQIDAIGILEDTKPASVGINVSKDTPKDIKKENLGKTVNTPGQEVAPVISPDGRTLYFTRNFNKANTGSPDRQDVWYSTLQPGGWSEAINIGSPINNSGDNAISGMAPDGRTAYLINVYRPDGGLSFGISKSVRTKTGWLQPAECRIPNNYNLHEKNQLEFCVSPDGRAIILAVQRKDTRGNRDLYISRQTGENTWSEPVSLGNVLNTADSESSPFLAADSRTLYFTSAGHPGYGNGDIFVSRRLDDSWTNWSEPENLGPAINTAEWDGYFTIPAAGDYAYLSSRAGSFGEDDIFRLKLYPAIKPDAVAIISGQVLDATTKKPIAASVVANLFNEQKEVANVSYSPETGEYKLILPTQKSYVLKAVKEGYLPTTEILDLSNEKRFREIRHNLYVTKVDSGQKIVLREILFQQSQSTLSLRANEELDRIVSVMEAHPAMELLVEGHTDNQGDWGLNMKLSEDRVQVVKTYLTGKGIAPNRIRTKALGASRPEASNDREEKRVLNRRVEFTILKL
ncbi:OmpA family protein [Spirosoma sp.]|uniref:OmpA family protein n=1 Tax=Spirosoma sp. TaxID=1899569 RepID=UPI003B3AC047